MKNNSDINVDTAVPELSNISNVLEQIEPIINVVDEDLTKQERKALKGLQKDQNLVIREAGEGNIVVIMGKDYYCYGLKSDSHLPKKLGFFASMKAL